MRFLLICSLVMFAAGCEPNEADAQCITLPNGQVVCPTGRVANVARPRLFRASVGSRYVGNVGDSYGSTGGYNVGAPVVAYGSSTGGYNVGSVGATYGSTGGYNTGAYVAPSVTYYRYHSAPMVARQVTPTPMIIAPPVVDRSKYRRLFSQPVVDQAKPVNPTKSVVKPVANRACNCGPDCDCGPDCNCGCQDAKKANKSAYLAPEPRKKALYLAPEPRKFTDTLAVK